MKNSNPDAEAEDFGWCSLVLLLWLIAGLWVATRLLDGGRWLGVRLARGAEIAWCFLVTAWWIAVAGQLPPARKCECRMPNAELPEGRK